MSSLQIKIQLPYPLFELQSITAFIPSTTLVSKIIQICLTEQHVSNSINPEGYYLYHQEKSQFLHPDIEIQSYFNIFFEKCTLVLLPKYFETVTVYYLNDIIQFTIDPNQTSLAVSQKAAQLLQGRHSSLNNWKIWSLAHKDTGERIDSKQPISSIPTRTFCLRREAHLPFSSPIEKDKPLFQGTLYQALARDDFQHDIPIFIQISLQTIEDKFLDEEGIYRKSGLKDNIDRMIIPAINLVGSSTHKNLRNFLLRQKAHDITGAIKQYLRQLSEPLIPPYLLDDFRQAEQMPPDKMHHRIKLLVKTLPTENYNLIKALGEHFENVTKHSEKNLMNYANLATGLGPCFVRTDALNAVQDTLFSQRLARILIEQWKYIFKDDKLLIEDPKNASIAQDNDELGVKKGDHISVISLNKVAKVKTDQNTEIIIQPDHIIYNVTEYPDFNDVNIIDKIKDHSSNISCLKPSLSVSSNVAKEIQKKIHDLEKFNEKIDSLTSGTPDEIKAKLRTQEGKELLSQLYLV